MLKREAKSPLDNSNYRYKKTKGTSSRPQLNFRQQKIGQYRSSEKEKTPKPGEIYHATDKSNSQQGQQRSANSNRNAVRHQYGRQDKIGQLSRSKSKEKKDRLTLNLAKLTRKTNDKSKSINKEKQEKPTESIYLQREDSYPLSSSNQSQKLIEESPYQLGVQTNQPKLNVTSTITHNQGNRQSMFSQEIDSIITDGWQDRKQQEKQKIELINKPRVSSNTRPIQKLQAPSVQNNYLEASSKSIPVPRPAQSSRYENSASKRNSQMVQQSSIEYLRAQKNSNHAVDQLKIKLQREKDEYYQKMIKATKENSELQQNNKQLIQAQFKMKNQIELLKMKNTQLINSLENARQQTGNEDNLRQKTVEGAQEVLKETQNQLNKVTNDLRFKASQNSQLLIKLRQLENQCHHYQNEMNSYQNLKLSLSRQIETQGKKHQSRMSDMRNNYECKMKQMSTLNNKFQEERLKSLLTQKDKQINILKGQLKAREVSIKELLGERESVDREQIKCQLQQKYAENQHLVGELNYNQDKIRQLTNQINETVRHFEGQIKLRQRTIDSLKEELGQVRRNSRSQGVDRRAFDQLYQGKQSSKTQANNFMEMQVRQSEETNAMRDQIARRTQQIHNLQSDNEQLRDKVRRLEQQGQISSRTVTSNLSNLKQAKQASQTVYKAEIQSLKRKMGALQTRIGIKATQIRQKNRFIKQNLMDSISNRQDATILISRLQSLLQSIQT